MKKTLLSSIASLAFLSGLVLGDIFGTGANQFTIDFVPISGSTNPVIGRGIVNSDYRMGIYEITNDQWAKFESAYGTVTGAPTKAYDDAPFSWSTSDSPAHNVSWYEAAQFVNFLNASTGHQAAYKFTGTQGTSDYTLGVWEAGDIGYNASNPYRNSYAYYFLPTEDEWVKAAYWNGTNLQTYATKAGESLYRGNGSNGGWNYSLPTDPPWSVKRPWAVGSSSQELNGTYDMMGNASEWTESPWDYSSYLSDSARVICGASYSDYSSHLESSSRRNANPYEEGPGFRVASIPEPCSLVLLCLGGLALRNRKR